MWLPPSTGASSARATASPGSRCSERPPVRLVGEAPARGQGCRPGRRHRGPHERGTGEDARRRHHHARGLADVAAVDARSARRRVRRVSLARRVLTFHGLFALGWGLHFLWNSPVPEGCDGPAIPLRSPSASPRSCSSPGTPGRRSGTISRARATPWPRRVSSPSTTSSPAPQALARSASRACRLRVRSAVARRGNGSSTSPKGYLDRLQAWGRSGTGVDEVVRDLV